MSRPERIRKVITPPRFKGFKPYGYYGPEGSPVVLHLEELETIRLLDYKNLSQQEAAVVMDVSRPTLTRIYERARNKVALAFCEARTLVVEGGKVYFDEEWFRCLFCNSNFNNPRGKPCRANCPVCGGNKIEPINPGLHQ
jgi:predicted DNA-binding protein (UPF0251 family)